MVDESNYFVPGDCHHDEYAPGYFSDAYGTLLPLVSDWGRDRVEVDYAELYVQMMADGVETDGERRERLSRGGSLDKLVQWGEGDYLLYFSKLADEGMGLIRLPQTPPPVEEPCVPESTVIRSEESIRNSRVDETYEKARVEKTTHPINKSVGKAWRVGDHVTRDAYI